MTSNKRGTTIAKKTRKTVARRQAAASSSAPVSDAACNLEEERKRIEVAAYFRAERRGFEPGAELDDWLQAEAEVRGGPQSA